MMTTMVLRFQWKYSFQDCNNKFRIKVLFQVFVGQSAEFPVVRERSVTLQPGREHFLEMAGFMVTTDQQAEGLDVKYRYGRFHLFGLQYLY